jgi:hypothetical protein
MGLAAERPDPQAALDADPGLARGGCRRRSRGRAGRNGGRDGEREHGRTEGRGEPASHG